MAKRKLFDLIKNDSDKQSIENRFVNDLRMAIQQKDRDGRRLPSPYYKPSTMKCLREMYFMRLSTPMDDSTSDYMSVGMADTGTRRHEAIQDALEYLSETGGTWKYIDVAAYIAQKQSDGKLLNLVVKGKIGSETALFDKVLQVSFRCDGILQHLETGKYYLFEFKNQVSFKFKDKLSADIDHMLQLEMYCYELDLNETIILYENRDLCELSAFLVKVTESQKQEAVSKILSCEEYVKKLLPPPVNPTPNLCKWCKYTTECRKHG